jgi:cation diffusion facilitator CzcD-associated flavoprotein CzcO
MDTRSTDVAIIGAGPYGLSIAAHLAARNVPFRIFGKPMNTWREHIPAGTFLKSFGFASSLYEPGGDFTIEKFCKERGILYADVTVPVAIETFIDYGLEFQRRFVPMLESTNVTLIQQSPQGYTLTTETGEAVHARRVVLAAGITHFAYTPPVLSGLPSSKLTHSSEHNDLSQFSGQTVAVIGGGASAADTAGLLHEAGATVHWISRRSKIDFHTPPGREPRPLKLRLSKPRNGLGQGWRALLCANFPSLFRLLPEDFRVRAVSSVNGPAPGYFSREKAERATMHLCTKVDVASSVNDKVHLRLTGTKGNITEPELWVDHVIAATGYRPDASRLGFLDEKLRSRIDRVQHAASVNQNFESSVPGLHLVGLASAHNFGPLCRFAYGAKYTAKRIAKHLAATRLKAPKRTFTTKPVEAANSESPAV